MKVSLRLESEHAVAYSYLLKAEDVTKGDLICVKPQLCCKLIENVGIRFEGYPTFCHQTDNTNIGIRDRGWTLYVPQASKEEPRWLISKPRLLNFHTTLLGKPPE